MSAFFDPWSSLGKTALTALAVYPLLILIPRLGGKRTLAKTNAFDFVVTVAIGSLLASALTSGAKLADALVAIAALVLFQTVVTWVSVRSDRFEAVVKSQPALVLHHGRFLEDAVRTQRVTREEIRTALRSQGVARVEDVAAVVLESDGSFSVLESAGDGGPDALAGVGGAEERMEIGPAQGPLVNPERGPLSEA